MNFLKQKKMKHFISLLLLTCFSSLFFAQTPIVFDADPENLGPKVNSEYSDISPTISPDGKTLFITRYPPDNGGKNNIWVSYLQQNGEWSLAHNIGTPLNVPGSSTSVQSIT